MSELFCPKCDCIVTLKSDNKIYKKITVDNIDLINIEKIINDYLKFYNKKFDKYFVKCIFNIKFDDDIYELDTTYVHYKEIYKIVIQLLFFIDVIKTEGKNFCNIDRMTININGDICNMTKEYSDYMRLNPIESRINIIFGKDPLSLNKISNNILIRNKSHILFNI